MTAASSQIFSFADPEQLAESLADGSASAMPVQASIRQQQTPVHIYWSP